MTDLNKQKLRRLAEATKGWQNLTECWPADEESDSDWEVGALDEDDNRYPVISVNTQQYDCEDGAEKLARFIAAANPAAILSLLDEVVSQCAEIEELDALSSRQSDLLSQAAVALRGPEPALTRYSHADIPSRVKEVVDERDQLRAEVKELTNQVWQWKQGANAEAARADELRLEVEALRKDSSAIRKQFEYWKQRAKSAEGHLYSPDSDLQAAAIAIQPRTRLHDVSWMNLKTSEQVELMHIARLAISSVDARRDIRRPHDFHLKNPND